MYVATVPNRKSPPAILLRESYREGPRSRPVPSPTSPTGPPRRSRRFAAVLRGATSVGRTRGGLRGLALIAPRPRGGRGGNDAKAGLGRLINAHSTREQQLCLAMIAARILHPGSKLALARQIDPQLRSSSLGESLGLEEAVDEDELYEAMDWLLERQSRIETNAGPTASVRRILVLYDLTSSYFEGRRCPSGPYRLFAGREEEPAPDRIRTPHRR